MATEIRPERQTHNLAPELPGIEAGAAQTRRDLHQARDYGSSLSFSLLTGAAHTFFKRAPSVEQMIGQVEAPARIDDARVVTARARLETRHVTQSYDDDYIVRERYADNLAEQSARRVEENQEEEATFKKTTSSRFNQHPGTRALVGSVVTAGSLVGAWAGYLPADTAMLISSVAATGAIEGLAHVGSRYADRAREDAVSRRTDLSLEVVSDELAAAQTRSLVEEPFNSERFSTRRLLRRYAELVREEAHRTLGRIVNPRSIAEPAHPDYPSSAASVQETGERFLSGLPNLDYAKRRYLEYTRFRRASRLAFSAVLGVAASWFLSPQFDQMQFNPGEDRRGLPYSSSWGLNQARATEIEMGMGKGTYDPYEDAKTNALREEWINTDPLQDASDTACLERVLRANNKTPYSIEGLRTEVPPSVEVRMARDPNTHIIVCKILEGRN